MKIPKSNIELKWLGHAGFLIKSSKIIYIDPYNIKENSEKADIVLITHSHYDHCSFADINRIVKNETRIIATADCRNKITRLNVPIKIDVIEPNHSLDLGDIKISTLPAYNIDKSFHPKEEGWVGYLIEIDNVIIYHSGDTDIIPEMQNLTEYRQSIKEIIALLPVGGKFTMSADEAFNATKIIKPKLAIPMHYGTIIGSEADALKFKELCIKEGINVEILTK